MKIGRRGFLGLAAASALAPLALRAAPPPSAALAAHRASRNTWLGPAGGRVRPGAPPLDKSYPGAPRLRLPARAHPGSRSLAATLEDDTLQCRFSRDPIALAELARLLHLTNGVTGVVRGSDPPELRRAAPSAGALYAGELYVVVERVEGLGAGVYSYAVAEHQLVEIRPGEARPAVAEAVPGEGACDDAAALVLIANVFERYTGRYGRRGWRYAFLDTGHIGENLRLAAASAGFAHASPLGFDEARLNALLGLDAARESVGALHALGRPQPRASPTELRASRSPAPAAGPTVEACILARRSARGFRDEAIAESDLARVLAMAQGYPGRRIAGVELRVFAHRVTGLPAGLYRYQPGERRLEPLRLRDDAARLVRACLFQPMAGSAAAGIVCVGDLAAAESELGYRALLLEAGAIAERVYLAAEALGLAARNLAAFVDDALDDLLELDGEAHAAIHLTVLGVEA